MNANFKIQPDEVTAILRRRLQEFSDKAISSSVGITLQVGDGIARVYGLQDTLAGELLEFPHGIYAMAMNLERDNVGCIILGDDKKIQEGDQVKATGRIMHVPTGRALLGRVVNALGQPLDGKGVIPETSYRPIERRAPDVIERDPVSEPLQTGIMAVDSMVPIGRGQRELIIGDRQTGKTALAIDTIINQKDSDVACIYVAIGQNSTVARVVHASRARRHGAYYCCQRLCRRSCSVAVHRPYSGCAMAEALAENGGHVLIVYDDLSKHAVAYRQLSLLLRRPRTRSLSWRHLLPACATLRARRKI